MNRAKIIKVICTCFCMCMFQYALAQEDERYQRDTTYTPNESSENVHILRIKKGYLLGDGITFISGKGNFNLSPSLQTLYLVNSINKNLSAPNSTFAINRARLNVFSNLFENKISLSARLNFAANYASTTTGNRSFNTVLQEANIEYRPNRTHSFNFGLRADYVDGRETRIEGESIGFIDRSLVSDAFDAIFDFGVRYKGNYRLGGTNLIKSYLSVTSGDSRSALQKNFGGFKYGIRLDYLPFDKFSRAGEFYMDDLYREEKPKLVIGLVYSYNDGATSAKGTNGGRWLYGDADRNVLLPSYTKFGTDYLFKYNGWYSMGSFVATRATVPNNIAGEFRLDGSFITYAAAQTAEQTKDRVLSRLNLGRGFNVQAGYLFLSNWAMGARYSTLKENNITAAFADYDRSYTFVTTKYLSGNSLKIQFELGYNQLREALKTSTQNGTYYSQVQFTIQL
jgi:phosphate-selective porin OprO and OprP